MCQRKLKWFRLIATGIIAKSWTIIGKCRVIWQRKLIRYLLITIGIIGILVIMLVVPLNFTPDTSVPFPYIPPAEGFSGYYTEADYHKLAVAFTSSYVNPEEAIRTFVGQSFIFKNVLLGGIAHWKTETYISSGDVQFVAQDPSDLKKLKEGDRVDIIGVCTGLLGRLDVIVILNCQFLPPGLAPLPLPGGPVFVAGY